jgi:hypothetical protein
MRCVVVGLGAVASSNQPACANRRFSTFLLDCISVEALALHCTDHGGSFGRMCRRNGRGVCVCARAGAVTSSEGLATAYVCRLLRIAACLRLLRKAQPLGPPARAHIPLSLSHLANPTLAYPTKAQPLGPPARAASAAQPRAATAEWRSSAAQHTDS